MSHTPVSILVCKTYNDILLNAHKAAITLASVLEFVHIFPFATIMSFATKRPNHVASLTVYSPEFVAWPSVWICLIFPHG
jgi:hypothetical protein